MSWRSWWAAREARRGGIGNPSARGLAPVTPDEQAWLSDFRQGDVVPLVELPVQDPDGVFPMTLGLGAVVVSQTCDVVQADRRTVSLAPIVRLEGRPAEEARDGKRPRFVTVPALGAEHFADLEVVATVTKATLVGLHRTAGVRTDEEVRDFARAVARRFGRFAFPDDVVPWLRPLEEVLASKATKPHSPEGLAIGRVAEIRVEAAEGWTNEPPYSLTLCFITRPEVFEDLPDRESLPDCPNDLRPLVNRTGPAGSRPVVAQLYERLQKERDPVRIYYLWQAIGSAWAARCVPKGGATRSVLEAIQGGVIGAEVISPFDFTYFRYRKSVMLDLDHLSSALPE